MKTKNKIELVILLVFLVMAMIYFSGCAGIQYTDPSMKYNYMEKRWEVASPKSQLEYNYYENEFRYFEK